MKAECHVCKKDDTEIRLRRCSICHKHFCEEHAYNRSGVSFCSQGCAEYFFFGDPDD